MHSKITLSTFLSWFSLYEIVGFVFLVFSIIAIVVFPCISIPAPNLPSTKCDTSPLIFTEDRWNFVTERFHNFTEHANSTANIVISAGEKENINEFLNIVGNLTKKGVHVNIFTNRHNVTFPKHANVKYFEDKYLEMHINFAVTDKTNFFFPSSFVDKNDNKLVLSYVVESIGGCESGAEDLNALFDMLWNRPKDGPSIIQKYKWMADKGFTKRHRYFNFLLDPFVKFPTGRMNHTNALFNVFSDLIPRIIFTKSFFPKASIRSQSLSAFTNIATLIESPSFSEFDLTLAVDENDFNNHIENYRSLLVTFKNDYDLLRCGSEFEFDGTVIVTRMKKLLFPVSISKLFYSNQLILGFYAERYSTLEKEMKFIDFLYDNDVCKGTPLP